MSAFKKLRYTDDEEGLIVVINVGVAMPGYEIAVVQGVQQEGIFCCARLDEAQYLARLLVGIEIQEDGAVWKRGPRGPAMPADAQGRTEQQRTLELARAVEDEAEAQRIWEFRQEDCTHQHVHQQASGEYCLDCGARLPT